MEQESLPLQVGRLVRQLRIEAGLSQEKFAVVCGLHRTYIGAIERGEKTISIETADKLVKAFGLSLSEFFSYLEQRNHESS